MPSQGRQLTLEPVLHGDRSELQAAIQAEERAFAGAGRVLVRWSGTEPLLRIMVEGRDPTRVAASVDRLEAVARAGLPPI